MLHGTRRALPAVHLGYPLAAAGAAGHRTTGDSNYGCALLPIGYGCRFHAASALRDAVVREWGMLGSDGRTALRSYLMSYLMAHAEEPAMQARSGGRACSRRWRDMERGSMTVQFVILAQGRGLER